MVRYGWKIPKRIRAPHPREPLSPVLGVVNLAESLEERLKHDAEATRVGLFSATRNASVSLAGRLGGVIAWREIGQSQSELRRSGNAKFHYSSRH